MPLGHILLVWAFSLASGENLTSVVLFSLGFLLAIVIILLLDFTFTVVYSKLVIKLPIASSISITTCIRVKVQIPRYTGR